MEAALQNYLDDVLRSFRDYKKLAERALVQVTDEQFFCLIDAESNSIAVIVKHVAGNLRSRWNDFLDSDGEKPDRNRDAEFELDQADSRAHVMERWEHGWNCLLTTLEALTVHDLTRKVTIRGEPHTVVEAINRQLTHYPMHIGQIILLAKHLCGAQWRTLSVAKNRSQEFNAFLTEKQAAGDTQHTRFDAVVEFSRAAKTAQDS